MPTLATARGTYYNHPAMPCQVFLDSEQRVVMVRLIGDLDSDAWVRFHDWARRQAAGLNPEVAILDLSLIANTFVSMQTIRKLAQGPPILRDPAKHRFVVAPSAIIYGLARMYQALGEESRPNLHVVRNIQAAYTSAGLRPPSYQPLEVVFFESDSMAI